ncbi:MAG: hypothetical protein HY879_03615 [Deltaproteobacteria bacterium]|nr:hypothetical protein [Deltaproteobacteria bacterium]
MLTSNQLIHLTEKYGLKIVRLDTTDITLIARIEILPMVFIEIYENLRKEKLNLALIFGNTRVFGVDREGGFYHEHPPEDPEQHIPIKKSLDLEDFIIRSIEILNSKHLL